MVGFLPAHAGDSPHGGTASVSSVDGEVGALPGKRIDDLDDLTVQGIWEAHLEGELAPGDVVDDVAIRAAGVLAEKGYWMWLFQAATEDLTTWQDLHGGYWVVDPDKGYIWEWGT